MCDNEYVRHANESKYAFDAAATSQNTPTWKTLREQDKDQANREFARTDERKQTKHPTQANEG